MKIKFVDFWIDLDLEKLFLYNILKKYYDIELSDKPDILFYSCFGFEHLKYTCKKVFYTGENIKPNFNHCDYAFSFEDNSEQNFHLPHFIEYENFFDYKNKNLTKEIEQYQKVNKSKFCSFMATNAKATERIEFVKKLINYKNVDCSGPVLYNMGKKDNIGKIKNNEYIDWNKEKIEIIKHYKFTIAFENERAENYITEKIYQPLLVKSIPIYWGAPNVAEYFNPKCYIDVSSFNSFEEAIEEIARIDQDESLYNGFFEEPAILPDSKIMGVTEENIYQKIRQILEDQTIPVGQEHKIKNYIYYSHKKIKNSVKKYIRKTINGHA